MIYLEIIIAFILAAAFIHFYLTRKKNDYKTALLVQHIDTSDELKKTLAMGLYLRFRKENSENPPKYSSSYIKQDPYMFESFVADAFSKSIGGSTWVSPGSGDFGVDFEHDTDKGLYLGQVKCYQGDLPFEPIAILHSNIVKKGAAGGYVITTGSFTPAARDYANGLGIELISGVKLVDLWLKGVENAEQEIKQLVPDYI